MSKEVENGEVLNMEGLSKGVYFYNLLFDSKMQSGKLVKD